MRALSLVLVLITGHVLAADTTTLSLVHYSNACDPVDCKPDFFKKGSLKIRTSNTTGSNGVQFKWIMTGGTWGGPANVSLKLTVYLSINQGACTGYTTPPMAMTNGTLRASFSASDFLSPIPESPGSVLFTCGHPTVLVLIPSGTEAPALGGIRIGSDDD